VASLHASARGLLPLSSGLPPDPPTPPHPTPPPAERDPPSTVRPLAWSLMSRFASELLPPLLPLRAWILAVAVEFSMAATAAEPKSNWSLKERFLTEPRSVLAAAITQSHSSAAMGSLQRAIAEACGCGSVPSCESAGGGTGRGRSGRYRTECAEREMSGGLRPPGRLEAAGSRAAAIGEYL
jgi:hypothetical protein